MAVRTGNSGSPEVDLEVHHKAVADYIRKLVDLWAAAVIGSENEKDSLDKDLESLNGWVDSVVNNSAAGSSVVDSLAEDSLVVVVVSMAFAATVNVNQNVSVDNLGGEILFIIMSFQLQAHGRKTTDDGEN